jgi:hypothetical protein
VHAVKHVGDQPVARQGYGNADSYASRHEQHDLAHDKPAYVGTGCPEGHADADFVGATAHYVGHEAVDSDAGEEDGEEPEEGGELGN